MNHYYSLQSAVLWSWLGLQPHFKVQSGREFNVIPIQLLNLNDSRQQCKVLAVLFKLKTGNNNWATAVLCTHCRSRQARVCPIMGCCVFTVVLNVVICLC